MLSLSILRCRPFLLSPNALKEIYNIGCRNDSNWKGKLLNKPKRPLNSYLRFVKQMEPEILSQYPDCTYSQKISIAGEMWRNCDPETKSVYINSYHEDIQKYQKDMEDFKRNLSPEEKAALTLKYEVKLEKKIRKKLEKTMLDLGKPTKPPRLMEIYILDCDDDPSVESRQKLIEQWKNLPDDKKEVYRMKYKMLFKDYLDKLSKWENKIVNTLNDINNAENTIKSKKIVDDETDADTVNEESKKKSPSGSRFSSILSNVLKNKNKKR